MNYLSIDVGGSAIKYAVMDETFAVESQGSREGRPSSHQEFLDIVANLYEQAGRPEGGVDDMRSPRARTEKPPG